MHIESFDKDGISIYENHSKWALFIWFKPSWWAFSNNSGYFWWPHDYDLGPISVMWK